MREKDIGGAFEDHTLPPAVDPGDRVFGFYSLKRHELVPGSSTDTHIEDPVLDRGPVAYERAKTRALQAATSRQDVVLVKHPLPFELSAQG